MAAKFEQKTMYKCKWCGKLFATATRHSCKFDPDKRNCLSCVHCIRVEKYDYDDATPYGTVTSSDNAFVCELGVGSDDDYTRIIRMAREDYWKLGCQQWAPIPDYKGKLSYAEQIVERDRNIFDPFGHEGLF